MKITFETPLAEAALIPPGSYDFEVVGWTPHKEERPLGPDKAMCQSVEYEIECHGGVSDTGEEITTTGRIRGTFKLVESLQWILLQYFTCIGDRKHGARTFSPNWTKEHNIGATGRVKIKHRKGTNRDFAEVDKWLDAEKEADAPAGVDGNV